MSTTQIITEPSQNPQTKKRKASSITNPKAVQRKSRCHEITQVSQNAYTVKSGSSGSSYTVILQQDQGATCTCEWGRFRKFNDPRSGCSHVIAVFNHLAEWENRTVMAWSSEEDARRQHRPTLDIGDGVVLTSRKSEPILVNWPTGRVLALEMVEVLQCLPITSPLFNKHSRLLMP